MKRYPQGQVIKSFSRALLNIQCSLSIVLAPLSTKFFLNVRWKRKIFLYVQSKKIINYCNGQRKDILVIADSCDQAVEGPWCRQDIQGWEKLLPTNMTNNIFQENNFLWPIITILPTHQISSNLSFAVRKMKIILFQCLSGIYSNLFSKKSWNKVQASNYPTKFVTNKLIHETQTDTESLSLLLTPVQLFTQLRFDNYLLSAENNIITCLLNLNI